MPPVSLGHLFLPVAGRLPFCLCDTYSGFFSKLEFNFSVYYFEFETVVLSPQKDYDLSVDDFLWVDKETGEMLFSQGKKKSEMGE